MKNKKTYYRSKKFRYSNFLNLDIFGYALKEKRITKSFGLIYFKFYRRLFKRPWNIFFRLEFVPRIRPKRLTLN